MAHLLLCLLSVPSPVSSRARLEALQVQHSVTVVASRSLSVVWHGTNRTLSICPVGWESGVITCCPLPAFFPFSHESLRLTESFGP